MRLAAGTMLGPYQVLEPLGRGGMGEVYRAHDTRLARDVAIKVLPERLAQDPDALSRFRREAKAVAALSHPSIRAIFDLGEDGGTRYAAMELLEGQSLGVRLAEGPLPAARAVEIGREVAQGLAAAHEKGIVHRDLKPENVFLTRDGQVKILDFGLARQAASGERDPATRTLAAPLTVPGLVVGTPGYMSPEQVRGEEVDGTTDVFALGCVLWEALAGRPAFRAASPVETMNAILTVDPPGFAELGLSVPPALERVVRRCLEKERSLRFPSAREVAFALQTVSLAAGPPVTPRPLPGPSAKDAPGAARRRVLGALLAGGLLAAGVSVGILVGRPSPPSEPTFRRVTYRRGNVLAGRFGPDGQTVVYSAAWDDRPAEVFVSRPGRPEARALGLPNGVIRSVAADGELSVLVNRSDVFGPGEPGDLVTIPLEGGAPRPVADEVRDASAARSAASLALIRRDGDEHVLEFPAGTPIHRSASRMFQVRVAPGGNAVAVAERNGPGSTLKVFDRRGSALLSRAVASDAPRLSWSPSGSELWYSLRRGQDPLGLHAVDLSGRHRLVLAGAGLVLHDTAPDGRVLVETFFLRDGFLAGHDGQPDRDLSWLEDSGAVGLSPDGTRVLFGETGEGGGEKGSVYIRGTDGAPPVRLGDGVPCDLSADGGWALALASLHDGSRLTLLPTGAGPQRTLDTGSLEVLGCGRFVPPGADAVLVTARESGARRRPFRIDLGSGRVEPAGPAGSAVTGVFAADGSAWLLTDDRGGVAVFRQRTGETEALSWLRPGETPVSFSGDAGALLVRRPAQLPAQLDRVDLASRSRSPWKSLAPVDRAGVIQVEEVLVTPDGKSWVFNVARVLSSDLWLVEGLR